MHLTDDQPTFRIMENYVKSMISSVNMQKGLPENQFQNASGFHGETGSPPFRTTAHSPPTTSNSRSALVPPD